MNKDVILNNRYSLQKVLGQGGMGKVYLAIDIQNQHQVAIKQINIVNSVKHWESLVAAQ